MLGRFLSWWILELIVIKSRKPLARANGERMWHTNA